MLGYFCVCPFSTIVIQYCFMKKSFVFICLSMMVLLGLAQEKPVYFCGQQKAQEKLFKKYPGSQVATIEAQERLEHATLEYAENRGGGGQVYIIPVVFHIIHQNGLENISDAQVHDAVAILTRDFRKQNADTSSIIDDFVDIAADVDIEFRLATLDPDGNCHSGINRIVDELTNDGYNSDIKALSFWPRNSYLNIWVCNTIGSGAAAYAVFPSMVNSPWSAGEDGIVCEDSYCGSIGTGSEFGSRVLTHEVGHWLNLYHTWGPSNDPGLPNNCEEDDQVTDTPNCIGSSTCNLNLESCNNGVLANIQNYMEYSYCCKMFTNGQRTRMRAALTSSTAQRNQLYTNANLIETGVINPPLCVAAFSSENTSVCVGDVVQFTDVSYHGVSSWSWNFGDTFILTGTDPLIHKNPQHIYATPGTYSVTLEIGNGTDNLSTTVNSFITVYASGQNDVPFAEGFENTWPANNWSLSNQNLNETWEITPAAQYSGDKSLKLRNYNNTIIGTKDILYTATYDLTGATAAYIDYKWAFACKTDETDDVLRISVSGDCGQTWSIRKVRKGLTNLPTSVPINSQFTPTSTTQWDAEILTLTNPIWFTPNFRVKFEFEGKGGNNFYLDEINITAVIVDGVEEIANPILYTTYPNPSCQNITLEITQPAGGHIEAELYDATGKLCSTLYNGMLNTGRHYIIVPKKSAGLYTLIIKNDTNISQQKIVFE